MKNISRFFMLLTVFVLICTMIFTMTGCKNDTENNSVNNDISINSNIDSNSNNNTNEASASADSTSASQNADSQNSNVQAPVNKDDEEGWFSLEVINQYSIAPFVQPPNTVVVSKPQRDCLYLKGDKDVLHVCADYAFQNIFYDNTAVYIPVVTSEDNSSANAMEFKRIYSYDSSALYPTGDETSVTFVYTLGRKVYECSLSLESPADAKETQICIAFADRTELYGSYI